MRMRTHLSERASKELLELMDFYGFTNTNHTLNVIISKTFADMKTHSHTPLIEVNNDQHCTPDQKTI